MTDKEHLDKETDKFLNRYRAQFLEDHYRSRKRTFLPTHLQDYCLDGSATDQYMRSHTEPLVIIELPHSALDVVVENDTRYQIILEQFNRDQFKGTIADTQRREHYLRRNSAGVKRAWDHYQLMLKLAWEGNDVE